MNPSSNWQNYPIGPAKSFFKNVIGGTMDADFDDLCQQVNSILVKMLAEAGYKRSQKRENRRKQWCINTKFGSFCQLQI